METGNTVAKETAAEKMQTVARESIIIGKHDPRLEPLLWVARAVDLKHANPGLQCLYADGENLVGTDGKRLHLYKKNPLPDGLYQIVKRTKTELRLEKCTFDMTFPDYKKIIPENGPDTVSVDVNGNTDGVYYAAYATIIRKLDVDDTLNYDYLADVLTCDLTFTVNINGKMRALYFTGSDRAALVMPMNMKYMK